MFISRPAQSGVACLIFVLALGFSLSAFAQSGGTTNNGRMVIDKWCRDCHVRSQSEKSSDLAPPFQEIIDRPGRDAAYLRAFMDQDHFPMTTFRLFDDEKDAVTAYLESLRDQ